MDGIINPEREIMAEGTYGTGKTKEETKKEVRTQPLLPQLYNEQTHKQERHDGESPSPPYH